MTDQRDEQFDPTTTAAVDATGMPIDPDQIDAPQSAPMDDAAGGPTANHSDSPQTGEEHGSEEIGAELGDFA